MKRLFLHPDPKIGASGSADYSKWQQGSTVLKQAGLGENEMLDIGQQLASGDVAGAAGDAVTKMTGNQTAGAAAQVLVDIVKTVIMKGAAAVDAADRAELANSKKQMEGISNTTTKTFNAADEYTRIMTEKLSATAITGQSEIDDLITIIMDNSQKLKENVDENKSTNEEKQEQIQKNNQTIEQNRNKMSSLLSEIRNKKSEANVKVQQNGTGKKENENTGDKSGTFLLGSTNTPEIDGLIQQYNTLMLDTEMLTMLNTYLTDQITTNTEKTSELAEGTIEVTEEQSKEIDGKVFDIMAEADNAKRAINEVKTVLDGQLPKLDEAAKIRIAGEMTKAAISGTESGLLAAAAAAMGLSSVFSFGSTASEAIELGQGAGNKLKILSDATLQASVEKTMKTYMDNVMKQCLGNVLDGIGFEGELRTQLLSYFDESKNLLAENIEKNENSKEEISDGADSQTVTNS